MRDKGFTLIELLAVIVILAIIALIATPIVLNIINSARISASKSSANGYLDAIEQAIAVSKMKQQSMFDGVYKIEELSEYNVSVDGEKPSDDSWIYIKDGKIKNYSFKIGNYVVTDGEATASDEIFDYANIIEYTPITELNYTIKGTTLTLNGLATNSTVSNLIVAPTYEIEGVTYTVIALSDMAFIDNASLKYVYLPATINSIDNYTDTTDGYWSCFQRCWNLEYIKIDNNNPTYKSVDGVVYTKTMKTLVVYPVGKKDVEYAIPEGVEKIAYESLYFYESGTDNARFALRELTLPSTLTNFTIRPSDYVIITIYNNSSITMNSSTNATGGGFNIIVP